MYCICIYVCIYVAYISRFEIYLKKKEGQNITNLTVPRTDSRSLPDLSQFKCR